MKKLINWIEIPSENFERALNFYNSVFDLHLKPIDCGAEKMACFPNEEGAITYSPGFKPGRNGVMISFNTGNNLNSVIEKIIQNGGEITQPKTKIEAENKGYFSVFLDSEGNKIGLYGDA